MDPVNPGSVVAHMMENDFFSQWMGVEVLEVREGYSRIRMTTEEPGFVGFKGLL
jgi:acyl-CoA thioesterase